MIQYLLQIVFMIFGTMIVAWFSRHREFRADAGSASIAGRNKMVKALQALQRTYEAPQTTRAQPAFQALMISNRSNFLRLFATHPPLEERIEKLQNSF